MGRVNNTHRKEISATKTNNFIYGQYKTEQNFTPYILLRLAKETRGIMVSVSIVRVSPDLGIAKAYLSVFPSEKANEVVNHLNENIKAIRFELGNRVRHQLRIIPEVRFYIDDSLDYIENIDKLLKE